jgi:ABC-type lipoprotein release transport system permease subunit
MLLIGHINELETAAGSFLAIFGVENFRVFPSSDFLVNRIPVRLLAKDIFLISFLTLGAGLLGALVPALRAARLNVVECLRHE